MSRVLAAVVLAAAAFFTSGCAMYERHVRNTEARQLAWTGPGAGPCLFGGITERADEHCAQVNFGVEGVLQAVNERVRAQLPATASCMDHVTAVRTALARQRDMRSEPVYTCPLGSRADGLCHVSLLVTDAEGEQYVLDNGSVVGSTVGAEGVTSLAAFSHEVEGILWVGVPPTREQVLAAIPAMRFAGETTAVAAR